jgi:cytochrome c-type biogenesis protein CcmH
MILFWSIIVLMLLAALALVIMPLLRNPTKHTVIVVIILIITVPAFSIIFYLKQDTQWLMTERNAIAMEKLRAQLGTPQQIIAKLEQHLQQHPDSAEGWYLLGKLYLDQQQMDKAKIAFTKARQALKQTKHE